MTTMHYVPSFGPKDATYAAVGQSPGRVEGETGRPFQGPAGSLGRDWLRSAGIDADTVYYCNVYEYVLLGDEKPTSTDVKHGIERVLRELAELPNLKSVILFGSYAARAAFNLSGGITRAHGKQGTLTLPDGREVSCVACIHPSYVLRQKELRKRQQLDRDARRVAAKLTFLDKPLVLPTIHISYTTDVGAGVIGLDTETAYQVGKKVDPRRDPLLITGLSDGRLVIGVPTLAPDAEPVAWNVPFDPVVTGLVDAKWHDGKVAAFLVGEDDTSMKGCATRRLNRPMMEYDPQLREKAYAHILAGDTAHDDVTVFGGYCVQDAVAHRDLLENILASMDEGTRRLYDRIERPMLRLYSKWTKEGVFRLDRDAALRKRDAIDAQSRQMRRDLEAETGVDSPNKHAKLAVALGIPSTNAAFIEREWPRLTARQRKVMRLVGMTRSLERMGTTYLDTWLGWDLPLLSTIWRPTAAWTGRPGSAETNLQNIPGPCGECQACVEQRVLECAFNLKPLLLPEEGYVLYENDNSQAELRVAAHLSQDEAMHRAFTEGIMIDGERVFDLHAWAQHRLGIASRRDAKIRVLATFYGQSEEGVRADAAIQQEIHRTFSGYVKWSNHVKRLSRVPGLFGRWMYVPPHPNEGHREREAVNCGSQGGAVDILKLQTLELEKQGFDTRHMIHDSVIVRVKKEEAGGEIERAMREIMENVVKLTVPLKVATGFWPH